VRARVPPGKASGWILRNIPNDIQPQHRDKFVSDVIAEIENLDASRLGGLGISRQEFEAWQKPGTKRAK